MLCRGCSYPAMHGIVFPVHAARGADIFKPAGKDQTPHNAALGFQAIGVIMVSPHKPRLCQKTDVMPAKRGFCNIQAFIRHHGKPQQAIFHLKGFHLPCPSLFIGNWPHMHKLLHAAYLAEQLFFLHTVPPLLQRVHCAPCFLDLFFICAKDGKLTKPRKPHIYPPIPVNHAAVQLTFP